MSTAHILRALLSHWLRSPLQLFTLLAGLALATALWSGVQAINAEARASYASATDQITASRFDVITAQGATPLTLQDYVALRRAGWLVSPQLEGRLANGVQVLGIEPLTAPDTLRQQNLPDMGLVDFLSDASLAIAGPEAAGHLRDLGFRVVESDALGAKNAVLDIGAAATLFQRGDRLDRLIVAQIQPLGRAALEQIAPHLAVTPASAQGNDDIARLTDSFHLNLTAFGLLAFAVGLFIVYGAIGMAFEQRRAMFRTLRALGVSLRHLIVVLALELLVLALLAGSLGIALGYVVAAALLPDVAATLRGLYGAEVSGQLQIRPVWWLSGLAMAVGGTAIAGAGTFWRLTQLPLLEAGAPQAWARIARRVIVVMALAGLALLAIAAGLALTAQSLFQGFALLAALLIGAALLLPLLLDRLLALAARVAPPPIPAWFWADTRTQVPGLSMALMALMLAIAANTGVSTMVSSFRLTFTGWLDQRLASELYVTTSSVEQAAAMRVALANDALAILPLLNAPVTLNGQAGELYAVADHATYRDNWPLLEAMPDVWALVQRPVYALVNEQLSLRARVSVGDPVPGLPDLTIVGVYSDYGNPAPQAMIGLERFQNLYPEIPALQFGLRVDPDDSAAITERLISEAGIPASAIADQARIKALSLGVFEQTFTVTAALNLLTLGVAGFSILMNLLTLGQMRLPQLAPVWALGLTRAQLGRLELLRAAVLAALVTCLALPLGLALAWVLMAIVNVAAFGWRLPMFLFPWDYVTLALSALGAAFLAAAWPAWRLARTAPHRLLQIFSAGR